MILFTQKYHSFFLLLNILVKWLLVGGPSIAKAKSFLRPACCEEVVFLFFSVEPTFQLCSDLGVVNIISNSLKHLMIIGFNKTCRLTAFSMFTYLQIPLSYMYSRVQLCNANFIFIRYNKIWNKLLLHVKQFVIN